MGIQKVSLAGLAGLVLFAAGGAIAATPGKAPATADLTTASQKPAMAGPAVTAAGKTGVAPAGQAATCAELLAQYDEALPSHSGIDMEQAKQVHLAASADCKDPATAANGVSTLEKALKDLGVAPQA